MTVTIDTTTLLGQVRMMIQDPTGDFFQDDALQVFLDLESSSVRLAAADALETIATNQVLLLKKISLSGLSLDGPSVAESLRKGAGLLRAQELGVYNAAAMFDVIETAWDPFSGNEILNNDWERTGAS